MPKGTVEKHVELIAEATVFMNQTPHFNQNTYFDCDQKMAFVMARFAAQHAAEVTAKLEQAESLGFAIQQFTGYSACVKGGPDPLMEMVESMGLTAKEYRLIRDDIQWLPDRDLEELDRHFRYRARVKPVEKENKQ